MSWFSYCTKAWFRDTCSKKGVAEFFSAMGALSSLGWAASLFISELKLPLWGVLGVVLISIGYAAYRCRPNLVFSQRISGRDVSIELIVADIMSLPGTLIIGSNTTFDTRISANLISSQSVQGQFTRRYYGDESQLDAEVSAQLSAVPHDQLQGKRQGKSLRYPVGTCVTLRPRGQTAYLLAIAEINEFGVASGSFDDLQNALVQLWQYVGTRGSKGRLLMPVIGTGFTRLRQSRETIIQEIILSFLAACTERTFADKLSIVITPRDMLIHEISLDDLNDFLKVHCLHSRLETSGGVRTGTPV